MLWFGTTGDFGNGIVILVLSAGVGAAWIGAGGVGTATLLVAALAELETTEVAEEMTAGSAALASMLPNATRMKVTVSFILIVVGLI